MTKRDKKFARLFGAFRIAGYALLVFGIAVTLAILAMAFMAESPLVIGLCVTLATFTAYASGLLVANIRTIG